MFDYIVKVKLSFIVLAILIVSTIASLIYYYKTDDEKAAALAGGVAAGLFVAVIQMLMDWKSYQASEKLQDLRIKQSIVSRDDRTYYGGYIVTAQDTIDIMGVSGERFMKDFVDDDPNANSQSRIVLDLLEKGVVVRILMPDPQYLSEDTLNKANEARVHFTRIKARYPDKFKVKYFSHIPAHSIFKVDNECIIGPVFPSLPSRFTPAIHYYSISPIVKKYMQYFEEEWSNASERNA